MKTVSTSPTGSAAWVQATRPEAWTNWFERVGLTAVELGALMGLKVIAAVGSDEKMEICRKYGATMFVNYAKEKMRDKVKELTGDNGADIIYDAVGGDAFDESVRCIAWYGRLLVVGFAAGRIPSLPANLALLLGQALSTAPRAEGEIGGVLAAGWDDELDALFAQEQRANDELKFLNYSFNNAEKIAGFGHWKYNLETKIYTFSDNFYRLMGIDPDKAKPTTCRELPSTR